MTHCASRWVEMPGIAEPANQVPLLEEAAARDLEKMVRIWVQPSEIRYQTIQVTPVSTGTPARPCSTSGSPSHARGSSTRNQKSGRSTFKYFSNNNTNDTCWSVDLTRLSQYPSFSCLPHTSSGYPAICGIQLDFFTNSWTDLHTSLFKQLLSILKEGSPSLQEVNEDTGVPPNLKKIGH